MNIHSQLPQCMLLFWVLLLPSYPCNPFPPSSMWCPAVASSCPSHPCAVTPGSLRLLLPLCPLLLPFGILHPLVLAYINPSYCWLLIFSSIYFFRFLASLNECDNFCCSVAQSCPTLCDPMDYTATGSPRACSNSCPLSQWRHPTISSSVVPFSSCFQSFRASGSFLMSQFFTSGSQSIGASASASVLPINIQGWFPLGWTGWITLQSKVLSRVFSNTTVQILWECTKI